MRIVSASELGVAILALFALYPGFPVAVCFDGKQYQVGILGIELDRDDWLLSPAPVETMVAGQKVG